MGRTCSARSSLRPEPSRFSLGDGELGASGMLGAWPYTSQVTSMLTKYSRTTPSLFLLA